MTCLFKPLSHPPIHPPSPCFWTKSSVILCSISFLLWSFLDFRNMGFHFSNKSVTTGMFLWFLSVGSSNEMYKIPRTCSWLQNSHEAHGLRKVQNVHGEYLTVFLKTFEVCAVMFKLWLNMIGWLWLKFAKGWKKRREKKSEKKGRKKEEEEEKKVQNKPVCEMLA